MLGLATCTSYHIANKSGNTCLRRQYSSARKVAAIAASKAEKEGQFSALAFHSRNYPIKRSYAFLFI